MADQITILTNPAVELLVQPLPTLTSSDLVYKGGGGTLFPNLIDDLIQGGYQWHQGNPALDTTPVFKACNQTSVTTTKVTVNSPIIQKGLFALNTSNNKYYWDEVYTTPLGMYEAMTSGTTLAEYQFYFTSNKGNELYILINDVNIVPKVNDFIFMQKILPGTTITNNSYTLGLNNLPVLINSEAYQFQITIVNIISTVSNDIVYKLTLDKSITPELSDNYSFVLLNRLNTGIQKELYYDTFEQIEAFRSQLLGDPYNNTTDSTIPSGRKNYLSYNSTEYLGVATQLYNIINNQNTPFIVYDIDQNIKDKFLIQTNTFSFMFPFLLFQGDQRTDITKPLNLINSGNILTETNGVGNYSALFFDWDTTSQYRIGWIFYDLRIIVIDHPEVATALSYNANRNYTLPAPSLVQNNGNNNINPGGGVDITITNVTNASPIIVTTLTPHGLQTGTPIYIDSVYVQDGSGNVILSNANGYHYAVLTGINNNYSFALYDSTLTVPVVGNGTFYTNPLSTNVPELKGTLPKYSYFFTYRMKGKHYTSTVPYSQTTDFNFAINGAVNNDSGKLLFTLPNIQWLIDNDNLEGFESTDLEIIIGQYLNGDASNPQLVTGITNIISIPISSTELTYPRNLFTSGVQSNFSTAATGLVITKSDYNLFLAKSGAGSYDPISNTSGSAIYDIVNNYVHYVYNNGAPVPSTLLTGNGMWTLGNITYQSQVDQFRTTIRISIPASSWNDTTNPTYDPNNPFITNRYISEAAMILTNSSTNTTSNMIYTKISPAIEKTNTLDLVLSLNIDF